MKTSIHPHYNPKATITCASCKTTFQAGSTLDEVTVEICSNCHPFYTGKSEQLIDTDNKIEKFRARMAATDNSKVMKKRQKVEARKGSKVESIDTTSKLTLKDMLKQMKG
jgi:large subunit ribosomal protein L31